MKQETDQNYNQIRQSADRGFDLATHRRLKQILSPSIFNLLTQNQGVTL